MSRDHERLIPPWAMRAALEARERARQPGFAGTVRIVLRYEPGEPDACAVQQEVEAVPDRS